MTHQHSGRVARQTPTVKHTHMRVSNMQTTSRKSALSRERAESHVVLSTAQMARKPLQRVERMATLWRFSPKTPLMGGQTERDF